MTWPLRVEFPDHFINDMFLAKCSKKCEFSQLAGLTPRVFVGQIVEAVCDEFDCKKDMILQKGLKKYVVRDVAVYLRSDLTGKSCVDFGKKFRHYFQRRHYGQIQSLDRTTPAQQQVEVAD